MQKILSKKSYIISILLILFSTVSVWAQIKLISPEEGLWSNHQMLVIDNPGQNEYFYSLNGADPEAFGFVYDGPVLIDVTGDVQLRIKKIGKTAAETEEKTVKYTVIPDDAFSKTYSSFISTFYDTGIVNYSAGSKFNIPSNLEYCMIPQPYSFIQGTELSISDKCVLTRYVPCTVRDPLTGKKWHFVIKTFPQMAGVFSRRDVPFKIDNWDKITFTNQDLIYKIDSDFWGLPSEPVILDRSQSHMIYWQSLTYEQGNPIEFFVLPPKPEVRKIENPDGSIVFSIEGDESYTLSVLSYDEKDYQELFTEIGADTFFGDSISGKLKIGLFTNSVYQGEIEAEYAINKRPAAAPVITASATNFYSRKDVTLSIKAEKNTQLYYAVSKPLVITDPSAKLTPNSELFKDVIIDFADYKAAGGDSIDLELTSYDCVYYKVRAYSDDGFITNKISEYSVVIDKNNYYYCEALGSELSDGSPEHPFGDFRKCMDVINQGRVATLHVKGNLTIPKGQTMMLSNTTIVNDADGVITFEKDASVCVQNSTISIENFRIQMAQDGYYTSQAKIVPAFRLESSLLDMKNCQIALNFGKNGTFADCYNSFFSVVNTIASVSSSTYGSFVSGVKTKINIQNSSVNISSDTGVIISLNDGDLTLMNNSFKVIGQKGRIAELFGAKGKIAWNSFKSDLKTASSASPVYKDKQTSITEENNDSSGF
ncbi:MAG: hypothetical protein MJ162_07990 [Treponema sp.]|nr:hypothetical protein [Treponema sp.]